MPIIQPLRCEGEIFPPASINPPLISQTGSWDKMLLVCHPTAMVKCSSGTFRGKAIPHTQGPPALYRNVAVSLDMCGSSGSIFYLKSESQNDRVLLSGWKECMWVTKTHFIFRWSWNIVKNEEEHNLRITLCGKWLFGSGKRSTALYPDPNIMPFNWKRVPNRGSNP